MKALTGKREVALEEIKKLTTQIEILKNQSPVKQNLPSMGNLDDNSASKKRRDFGEVAEYQKEMIISQQPKKELKCVQTLTKEIEKLYKDYVKVAFSIDPKN